MNRLAFLEGYSTKQTEGTYGKPSRSASTNKLAFIKGYMKKQVNAGIKSN